MISNILKELPVQHLQQILLNITTNKVTEKQNMQYSVLSRTSSMMRQTWSGSNRTRENNFEPEEERFRLDVRRKLFTQRAVRHWHSCPAKMDAPSLESFKAGLDGALGSLIQWVETLPSAGCWNCMIFKVPSNSNRSVILQFHGAITICIPHSVMLVLPPHSASPYEFTFLMHVTRG